MTPIHSNPEPITTGGGVKPAPLTEFGDFVTAGNELIAFRDNNSWELGDLAAQFEIKLGRPDDPEAETLGDLAREWSYSIQSVSAWRNVSIFYPTSARTFDALTWQQYNLARRDANKRHADYEDAIEHALKSLQWATDQYMGLAAFNRYLKGIRYEGRLDKRDDWNTVKAALPDGDMDFWIVINEYKEGE